MYGFRARSLSPWLLDGGAFVQEAQLSLGSALVLRVKVDATLVKDLMKVGSERS